MEWKLLGSWALHCRQVDANDVYKVRWLEWVTNLKNRPKLLYGSWMMKPVFKTGGHDTMFWQAWSSVLSTVLWLVQSNKQFLQSWTSGPFFVLVIDMACIRVGRECKRVIWVFSTFLLPTFPINVNSLPLPRPNTSTPPPPKKPPNPKPLLPPFYPTHKKNHPNPRKTLPLLNGYFQYSRFPTAWLFRSGRFSPWQLLASSVDVAVIESLDL